MLSGTTIDFAVDAMIAAMDIATASRAGYAPFDRGVLETVLESSRRFHGRFNSTLEVVSFQRRFARLSAFLSHGLSTRDFCDATAAKVVLSRQDQTFLRRAIGYSGVHRTLRNHPNHFTTADLADCHIDVRVW
ncbi:hypothetical protein [Paraburkholderia sp. RL17-347-BIC-D]|uniref:hypothetical protein n=1 Tax=Paraburkholderia sp. RL17-347-BIC-D TaxID=3031632 RepID=UPI0038B6E6D6